jgi:hypothetical protein
MSEDVKTRPGFSPPVPRQEGRRWTLLLIVLGLVFAVPGTLIAVAIPVFFTPRLDGEFRATSVDLPPAFNGHQRNTGTKARAMARTFAVAGLRVEDVAVYGKIGSKTVVVAAHKPATAWSPAQQSAGRNQFEQALAARGTPVFLIQQADPDGAGGWVGCGTTGAGLEICLATGVGSMVTVISGQKGGDPVTLLRQARAATVHRSS